MCLKETLSKEAGETFQWKKDAKKRPLIESCKTAFYKASRKSPGKPPGFWIIHPYGERWESWLSGRLSMFIKQMGVSKNRGTPKWMVYNGKPYQHWWFGWKTHYLRRHPNIKCQALFDSLDSQGGLTDSLFSEGFLTRGILQSMHYRSRIKLTFSQAGDFSKRFRNREIPSTKHSKGTHFSGPATCSLITGVYCFSWKKMGLFMTG